jgi:hypothetical protein
VAATAKVPGLPPGGVPGKEKARLGKGGQRKKVLKILSFPFYQMEAA